MGHSNPTMLPASVATLLCAALLAPGAMAGPKLQTVTVTPSAKSISVGQQQAFTATGTFSNGSTQVLGPALSNIATGYGDTCALLTSGGVECWGSNGNGELGDGSTTNSLSPRPVKGISTATAIAFGGSEGCARLASGALQCWGLNLNGQLGNGSTVRYSTTPVGVAGISTATALAVGAQHACAVLASGAVRCWGYNYVGELGDGTNQDSNVPVNVVGISTATAVAVGGDHTCALLASGAVQCWGGNFYGELGNGSSVLHSYTPVTVSGIGNARAVAAGNYYSCALLASGAVKCWGYDSYGQLGNGTGGPDVKSTTPVSVVGINTAVDIAVGEESHACATLRDGSVQCWGANVYGQLGDGTTANSNTPVAVQGVKAPTHLSAGASHTCALFSGGAMTCWGRNDVGQLGRLWRDSKAHPLAVNVAGTPGVVWTSSNPTKARITDRGVATGQSSGNTTITATTAGSVNDNALLTVK